MDEQERELLRQMSQRLERIEKRQRRARWWKAIVWCCVLAVLVGLAFYAGPKVIAAVQKYNDAVDKIESVSAALEGVNMDKLKETMDFLGTVDYGKLREKADELGKLSEQLGKLDIDALTEEVASLKKSIEPVLKYLE